MGLTWNLNGPSRFEDGIQALEFFVNVSTFFSFIKARLGHSDGDKNLEKVHKTKNNEASDNNNKEEAQAVKNSDVIQKSASHRFFSQLEREAVEGLIQKYHIDLAMWGYKTQEYLDRAK